MIAEITTDWMRMYKNLYCIILYSGFSNILKAKYYKVLFTSIYSKDTWHAIIKVQSHDKDSD